MHAERSLLQQQSRSQTGLYRFLSEAAEGEPHGERRGFSDVGGAYLEWSGGDLAIDSHQPPNGM